MDRTRESRECVNREQDATTRTAGGAPSAVAVAPGGSDGEASPIAFRSQAWLDALDAQLTPMTMRQAASTARAQLGMLARLGLAPGCDDEDLTHQLVEAILTGIVRWDPAVPLGAFLHNKLVDLGRRLRRGRRLSIAAAMVLLDHCDEQDPVWAEGAVHSPSDTEEEVEMMYLARRTEAEIVTLAARDTEALLVLAAMPDAPNDREVAAVTGLPRAAVAAAKKRVRRYAAKLSPELRADVRAALGSARDVVRETTGKDR